MIHTARTLAALCVFAASAASAFTPALQEAIGREAMRLAPPDFFRQLEKHEQRFYQGVSSRFRDVDATRHYKNQDGTGQLDLVIEEEVARLVRMIEGHSTFADISYQAGVISYHVAAANNPLNTSTGDPEEERYYRDYAYYLDSAAPRLPVIFYGLDQTLERGDVSAFVGRTLERGRLLYPMVGAEYRRIGKLPGRQYFDDKSTAFGTAAVAYSRAISDTALLLRWAWLRAGGRDHRNTPDASDGRLLMVARETGDG